MEPVLLGLMMFHATNPRSVRLTCGVPDGPVMTCSREYASGTFGRDHLLSDYTTTTPPKCLAKYVELVREAMEE